MTWQDWALCVLTIPYLFAIAAIAWLITADWRCQRRWRARRTSVDDHADQAWQAIADAASPTDFEQWEREVSQ